MAPARSDRVYAVLAASGLRRVRVSEDDDARATSADDRVYALTSSGQQVIVGGWFKTIGGAARRSLARLDQTTGAPDAWSPTPDKSPLTLIVAGGNVVAGGAFTMLGAVDATTAAVRDVGRRHALEGRTLMTDRPGAAGSTAPAQLPETGPPGRERPPVTPAPRQRLEAWAGAHSIRGAGTSPWRA